MARATEIAKHLIKLAAREAEPEFLTNLRVQKLLYYIQGWTLALRGQGAFSEPVEAWIHGPVVYSVYKELGSYGDRPIPPGDVEDPSGLTHEEMNLVASVWEAYKKHSATELYRKTHSERPWLEARQGYEKDELCRNEISPASMAQFFKDEYNKSQIDGLDYDSAVKMISPSRPRRGKPFEEILSRVGLEDARPSN